MKSTLLLIAFGCATSLLCSASQAQEQAPGIGRSLGIQANLGQNPNFDEIFAQALRAGSETQVLPQDWNELETGPGQYEPSVNYLAIANLYYGNLEIPIHLTLRPIHTNQKVVPADLMTLPLDHPRMIARFKDLLRWSASQLPQLEVSSLTIGSEVDLFLWGDAERWQAWINFYTAVVPYAREMFPGTLVSCETTHASFVGPDLARVRRMHRLSDAIGVSYYPLRSDGSGVRPPTSVHDDFAAVVSAIADKPILYYQIGYPSSPVLESSQARQAAFVAQAFKAWDQHASRIALLNFQWMHETTSAGLNHYADYYGYDTPEFRAFLGSLGLRDWEGTPKLAWKQLATEARQRGFGR